MKNLSKDIKIDPFIAKMVGLMLVIISIMIISLLIFGVESDISSMIITMLPIMMVFIVIGVLMRKWTRS